MDLIRRIFGKRRATGYGTILKLKERRDVDGLINSLSSENWMMRSWAVEALTEIGDYRAVPALLGALRRGAPSSYYGDEMRTLLAAISKFGDRDSVPVLQQIRLLLKGENKSAVTRLIGKLEKREPIAVGKYPPVPDGGSGRKARFEPNGTKVGGSDDLPPPYEGPGKYVFVSYKREDIPIVATYLKRLSEWGYNAWYDRGIPGGAEWDAMIEEKVKGCAVLLVFLSQAAADSKWVRREIKLADREGKPILTIRLGQVVLHSGLDIVLNQYQSIDSSARNFEKELRRAMQYTRLL